MSYQVTREDPAQSADNIATLWTEVFGPFPRERYRWLYQDNPAGEALLCLLQDGGSHEILGSNALFPRPLRHGSRRFRGGIAGDLMVLRSHRSLGPAVQLQRAMIGYCGEADLQLPYGFPNKKSAPIMQRVGYQKVGAMVEWVLPLHSAYYLQKHIRQPWLRRPLAVVLDLVLRLRPGPFKWGFDKPRNCYTTNTFDACFDDLWSRIASRYSLVGEKSASFLDWRYRRCPSGTRRAFVVKSTEGERLDGYVIFSIVDKRAHIADFAHDAEHLDLDELLKRFIHAQRQAGMDAISAPMAASTDITRHFERRGFRARGEMNPLMLFIPPGVDLAPGSLLEGPWYLVPGDNDT